MRLKVATLWALAAAFVALAVAVSACGSSVSSPTATPAPKATQSTNPFAGVPGIIDPNNHSFPRDVEGLNGRVTIKAKPQHIVSLSVGHDEMTYALVPASRVAGVHVVTKTADFSNVADISASAPSITTDPESILSVHPDVMVTSPFFPADKIAALTKVGLAVVQTDLRNDPRSRIENILLLGYIYGEEDRAVAFAREVQQRYDALQAVVQKHPAAQRSRVMSTARFADKIYTAGKDSTEGAIIDGAAGINVAADAGLERNPSISIESIVAMRPDVIIITQSSESGEPFKQDLLKAAVLQEVPAIKNRRVYVEPGVLFTTLSFWNLRGAEELARILWPQDFAGKEFPKFSLPNG
ncbi:MAG: ABC transporter substrate-binding protein [Chloroflexi bacterium]|nr:ABC transporter substrate-binding protein [Chloroflexota bacterium]